MKKRDSPSFKNSRVGLQSILFALLSIFFAGISKAQDQIGNFSFDKDHIVRQITVPTGFSYIYLEANGGDGGKSTGAQGGRGAKAVGYFSIGSGAGQIPSGATLRFIPGQAGEATDNGGGGGGGTGIAFQTPSGPWHILVVAGGGGGSGENEKASGREGTIFENGSNGLNGSSNPIGGAGFDGNDGTDDSSHGRHGYGYKSSLNASGEPVGRSGGTSSWADGGFGFGSGGACNNSSGGGGGGYSGGGGGGSGSSSSGTSGTGGGGGSYVNPNFAILKFLQSQGTTYSPKDGYISYRFTNNPPIKTIHLAKDQTKCMDLKQSNTTNGTNIQLYDCNGTGAQEFTFDGLEIKLAGNINKCVDLADASTTNGKNIQLWDCSGKFNQQWVYDGLTKNVRTAMNWNKCFDLVNAITTNGNNIQLWDCNDIPAQRWIIGGATLADITNDNTRIHFAKDESKCVDIQAAGTANGTNVQIYHCHEANSQYWIFDGLQIKMKASPDKCLDLNNSNTNNGNNIQLFDCNGTFAQKWIYDGINKSIHSGIDAHKCLDLLNGNTADHTNIQIWDCQPGNTNQQFVIEE